MSALGCSVADTEPAVQGRHRVGRRQRTPDALRELADRQPAMSIQALGPVPDQWRNIPRQHDEFIAALEARDEARFAATLRAHLDGTHRR